MFVENGGKRTLPAWPTSFSGDGASGISDAMMRVVTFWLSGCTTSLAPDLPVDAHDAEIIIVQAGSDCQINADNCASGPVGWQRRPVLKCDHSFEHHFRQFAPNRLSDRLIV